MTLKEAFERTKYQAYYEPVCEEDEELNEEAEDLLNKAVELIEVLKPYVRIKPYGAGIDCFFPTSVREEQYELFKEVFK